MLRNRCWKTLKLRHLAVGIFVCLSGCQKFANWQPHQGFPGGANLRDEEMLSVENAPSKNPNANRHVAPPDQNRSAVPRQISPPSPSNSKSEPIRATIRGQSPPSNSSQGSPGSNEWYRGPMTPATSNATTVSQPIGSGLLQQGNSSGGYPASGTSDKGTTTTAFQNPQSPGYLPNPQSGYNTAPVGGEPINAFQQSQPNQFSGIPNYPQAGPNPSAPSFGTLQQPWAMNSAIPPVGPGINGYTPRVRDVPIDVILSEGQTGRIVLGGSVNTDLGVAGQVIVEERNFDIRRFPRSFRDMFNGAFRGNGENFRLELVPGNQVQRYTVNWTQPNLFGYSPYSLSVGGFLFNRIYRDWSEQRLGGRVAVGYEVTPDLSVSTELRGENVDVYNPRISGLPALDSVVGGNELYTGRFRLAHNTRDSPFLPTEGHFLELIYDQVFGSFDYPRGQINYSRYFMLRERADGTGRHTLTNSIRFGVTGAQTPIYENFFAGGYTTLRGFRFRGAGPVDMGIQTGGQLMFLGTVEYMFPLSADDMIRMVAFVDYGTVERTIKMDFDNFRVAPGLGFRVAVPAMGPAPLAFDFAVPVQYAPQDKRQVFSFSVGITR